MAKKVILKDQNNIEVLPITRGELILDSSGNRAFHSNQFLATDSQPGLMSATDKQNLDNITDKFTTYNVVSTTADGLAPKLINTNTNPIGNAYYVLASTNGSATPSWYKLPANAFANDDTKVTQTDTTTYCDYRVLLSGNDNDDTETTIARKSNKLQFNPSSGKLTAKTFMGEFFTVRSTEITNTWRPYNVMAWFPNINKTSDNYAGDNTGFPVSSNANGILWLGTHPASGGSDSLGYGHQLGFSSNGNIYSRYFHSNVPTTANGGSWKQIAFTTSNITGNAASATKLQNKRKLWGQDFDGTADVKGTITINGTLTNGKSIQFPGGEYLDGAGNMVLIGGEPINSWNVMVNTNGTTTSVFKVGETGYGTFQGVVTAPTFKGNLDGTYVNKLTGYSKATAAADLDATDSLNVALGKLEYKADTAYDWIISVIATDTDKYINKWQEILDFLNKVDDTDGADITDEFVTRKTNQDIIGTKTFKSIINTTAEKAIQWKNGEYLDKYGNFTLAESSQSWNVQDPNEHYLLQVLKDGTINTKNKIQVNNSISNTVFDGFVLNNNYSYLRVGYSTGIDNCSELSFYYDENTPDNRFVKLGFYGNYKSELKGTVAGLWRIKNDLQVTNSVTAKKFVTQGGTPKQFVKGDGSLDSNVYTHTSLANSANKISYSTGSALSFTNLQYLIFNPADNSGKASFLLIADVTNWETGNSFDAGIIGTLYGYRAGNQSRSVVNHIVAQVTSYTSGAQHTLYTDVYNNRVLRPYIVSYNGKKYLALKKYSSGQLVYFIGYAAGLLNSSEYIDLLCPSDSELPEGMTILNSPGFAQCAITSNKLSDGTNQYELIHSGNYTSYLGYIGKTKIQNTSKEQAISGITTINNLLQFDTNKIKVSGDITLYTDSGNSPRLIFQRGILTNDAYDWDQYVTGGAFKIRYNPGTNQKEQWIDVLSMHPNMITTPWNIGSLGFCKTNSSNNHILLGGGDHKLISDFVLKSELLQSNLTVISKTIIVGSDWVDTGIVLNSETFPEGAGSYIVQVARGSTYVWTGVMTVLLSTNVTREGTEEILLHGGGFDMGNDHHTFLRTYGDTTNKIYKLQIARNGDPEEKTFTFKFKRMI